MIPQTLDYGPFLSWLEESPLGDWGETLPELLAQQLRRERWGDMPEWEETLRRLPEIDPLNIELKTEVAIGDTSLMDKGRRLALQATAETAPLAQRPLQLIWYAAKYRVALGLEMGSSLTPLVALPRHIFWMLAAAMATTAGECLERARAG